MTAFLLVDSDRNFRRMLEVALRLEGAEVESAGAADEARSLQSRREFDVVVVDTLVADSDGLLSDTRTARARTVAVGPHPELLARAARLHGVATLLKPFGAAELLAVARCDRDHAAA